MSEATTAEPRIDPVRLDGLQDGDVADLRGRAELEGVRFAAVTCDALDLASAHLDGVELQGLTAAAVDLGSARLREVVVRHVDTPALHAKRGRWRDVRVTGRLGSVDAYDSEWRSVAFSGCKISYLNLRGAQLTDVAFQDCRIDELDLMGARLTRVALTATRVATLNVQDGQLVDVDLRRTELETVVGLRGLTGATITPDQLILFAPLLAAELGLKVEE